LPENQFAPAHEHGLARRLAAGALSRIVRFGLPPQRRYRIIVKSGKDIQPIFTNPPLVATIPLMRF
jgi:hypothetical protein